VFGAFASPFFVFYEGGKSEQQRQKKRGMLTKNARALIAPRFF
jgi:hypothetical protein